MQTALKRLALLALCSLGAASLLACGGRSDLPEPDPPKPAMINAANYADVAATGTGTLFSSLQMMSASQLVAKPPFAQADAGTLACPQGGSLLLSVSGGARDFTALGCQTEDVRLVSGSLSVAPGSAGATVISSKQLSLTAVDASLPLRSFSGTVRLSQAINVSADLTVKSDARTDSLVIEQDQAGALQGTMVSVALPGSVAFQIKPGASVFYTFTSKVDGSAVKVTPKADGQSVVLDLLSGQAGNVLATRTLSSADWQALIKKLF